jgi:hypothetical protein
MTRRAAIILLLSAVGVALLVWQVGRAGGLSEIRTGLLSVGLGFLPIVLLALVRFLARSNAWLALLGQPAPMGAALAATIGGDALGNLTPFGLAASEPAKAVYLGRHVDRAQALAALTAENFFYSVSVILYIVVGTGAMLSSFDLPDNIHVAGIAALALMAVLLTAAIWIAWQRPAAASALLSYVPSTRLRATITRVRAFEVRTYGSVGQESARLGVVFASEFAFHTLSLAECWLTLWLLTGRSLLLEALILDSVGRVINIVFRIVPFRTGFDEVSATQVAAAIGVGGANGLVLALVRKVRMIVFAAIGMFLLGHRARARQKA